MIILDTNVLSELMRPAPEPAVLTWLRAQSLLELATTTISIAEIKYGLARLPTGRRRRELEGKFSSFMSRGLAARIVDFDRSAAEIYGDLMAVREQAGRNRQGFDGLIFAIARSRDADIATRNTADFEGCGVRVVNPWNRSAGGS